MMNKLIFLLMFMFAFIACGDVDTRDIDEQYNKTNKDITTEYIINNINSKKK